MSQVIQNKVSAVQDRCRVESRGSGQLPGSRRTRGGVTVVAAVLVATVVAIVLFSGSDAKPAGKYGALPNWLPKTTTPTDHLVTATASHPTLAVEGDTVRVDLPQIGRASCRERV
jgi:hypothetical protein